MRYLVRFFMRGLFIGLAGVAVAACVGLSGDDARWPIMGEAGQSAEEPLTGINAIRLRVARNALENGDYDTAIRFFQSINEDAPGHFSVVMGLGDANLAKQTYDAAENAFLAAIERFPNKPETYEGLGRVLVAKGDFRGAIQAFNRTLARAPSGAIHNKLGVAHDLLGDGEGAQRQYRAALLLDPDIISARNNLALSLAISENYDAAIAEMEMVASKPAATDRHRQNLALVYGMAGQFDAVARVLEKQGYAADELTRREALFGRIRSLAKAGDRAAILAYLNSGKEFGGTGDTSAGSQTASLPAAPASENSSPAAVAAPTGAETAIANPAPKTDAKAEPQVASLSPEQPASTEAAPSEAVSNAGPANGYRIQLASYRSEKRAFLGKAVLEKMLGDKAAGLKVLVKRDRVADSMAIDYRVRSMALNSREAGLRLCEEIRAAGHGDCLVIRHNPVLWAAAAASPAGETTVAERPYRIQLASYRSQNGAIRGRKVLAQILGHGVADQFEIMVRKARNDDRKGFDYRIRSRPNMTLDEAQHVCDAIHSTGYAGCLIIRHNDRVWETATTAEPSKRAAVGSRYSVQLASYQHPQRAAEARKRLSGVVEKSGTNIKLLIKETSVPKSNKTFYRVRTSALENQAAARRLCAEMRAVGHTGCWILKV